MKKIIKIIIRISQEKAEEMLNESRKTKGKPVRLDAPHFAGDLIHAHKELGRFELAWDVNGKRRHPNKFPAEDKISRAIKVEIAKKLKVDPNILEVYQAFDELEGEDVFLISEKPKSVRILEKIDEILKG